MIARLTQFAGVSKKLFGKVRQVRQNRSFLPFVVRSRSGKVCRIRTSAKVRHLVRQNRRKLRTARFLRSRAYTLPPTLFQRDGRGDVGASVGVREAQPFRQTAIGSGLKAHPSLRDRSC